MATIIRQSYIDKIEKYLGKETIIVLVGQRRVGKSCMMKMIRDRKIKLSYLCPLKVNDLLFRQKSRSSHI